MKNKKVVLIISIIMILILIMSGTVYAYFTTSAEASGNVTFIFNDTEIAVTSKLENGKLNINIENILDLFEDEITVNYLSGIMSSDFEITDVDKCIEDVLVAYRKELLLQRRNEILGKIDNRNLTKEEVANLEAQLNEVIIQLAKIK